MNTLAFPTPADPFTAAYQDVCRALANGTLFPSLVTQFNSFADGVLVKLLDNVSLNLLPECTLLNSTFVAKPYGSNSKDFEIAATFPLVIATNTMQVATVNRIKWAAMGALFHADLENKTFSSATYIRDWNVISAGDTTQGIQLPTLIAGENHARAFFVQGSVLNINLTIYGARSSLPA